MAKLTLNGSSVTELLFLMLTKHGPFAVMAVVLCFVVYYFALEPMKARENMLYDTLNESVKHNQKTMEAIEENTDSVSESIQLQQQSQERITEAMEERVQQAKETQEVMFKFSEDMMKADPKQEEILGEILTELKKKP